MDIAEIFNQTPFIELLGIEVTMAEDGHAEGHLPFREELRSSNHGQVAHGGATYAFADTVGGAAVISLAEDVSPTVDMRMDYLAPATDDLYASADVLRFGSSLATVRVEVRDADDTHVATAHGTYKSGGQSEDNPWQIGNRDDPTS
jgi:uncharacterized protein (TIGR00369 family)